MANRYNKKGWCAVAHQPFFSLLLATMLLRGSGAVRRSRGVQGEALIITKKPTHVLDWFFCSGAEGIRSRVPTESGCDRSLNPAEKRLAIIKQKSQLIK